MKKETPVRFAVSFTRAVLFIDEVVALKLIALVSLAARLIWGTFDLAEAMGGASWI